MRTQLLVCLLALVLGACSKPNPDAELHRAARLGRGDEVQKLVQSGSDVNRVVDGQTPLQAATKSPKADTMNLLLEAGADPTVKDDKGRDLWDLTVPKNRFISRREAAAMAVLVEHGFQDRITLTEAAQRADNAQLIAMLLKHGADLHEVDEYGWTPLHHAAERGHAESCSALLQAGADPSAESTKLLGKERGTGDSSRWTYKYEAGSRVLDVASYKGSGRTGPSAHSLVKEWGGTNNEEVKNLRRK